jgi:hypothetical protein
MPDVVVTVPKSFGLDNWVAEGDAAGEPWSGAMWDFYTWGRKPDIQPGERVYVIYNGKLRGYAPLVSLEYNRGAVSFWRGGGAVAVTVDEPIRGFRGWRYRWWSRVDERPFDDWRIP